MNIDYEGYTRRHLAALLHLAALNARPADPREAKLPVAVTDRCRRAKQQLNQATYLAGPALRAADTKPLPGHVESMALAEQRLAAAKWELDLADQLIQELTQ